MRGMQTESEIRPWTFCGPVGRLGCCRLSTALRRGRRRPTTDPWKAPSELSLLACLSSLVDPRVVRCIRPQSAHPWLTRSYFASARTSVPCHGSSMHRTGHSRWARVRGTETIWCGGFIAALRLPSLAVRKPPAVQHFGMGGGQEVNGALETFGIDVRLGATILAVSA